MTAVLARRQVSVAELVEALRVQQGRADADQLLAQEPTEAEPGGERSLLVIGAHPGAGATAVAVAVADAIADLGSERQLGRAHLVDAADQATSGMGAASRREVGASGEGWRAGCRGSTTVLWPAVSPASPRGLPALRTPASGWLIIDAGWPWREVVAEPNEIRTLTESSRVVVVCRASVPGVRHVELALESLPAGSFVAAVGARRWPTPAEASFGPRLAQTVRAGRAVLFPSDPRVAVNGIDAEAFPRPVADAAARLVGLLWPEELGSSQKTRRRGLRR
jgi:hypothetical protein